MIKYNRWQQRNGPIIHDVTCVKYNKETKYSYTGWHVFQDQIKSAATENKECHFTIILSFLTQKLNWHLWRQTTAVLRVYKLTTLPYIWFLPKAGPYQEKNWTSVAFFFEFDAVTFKLCKIKYSKFEIPFQEQFFFQYFWYFFLQLIIHIHVSCFFKEC